MYHIIYTTNFRKQAKKIVRSGKCPSEKIENVIDIISSGVKIEEALHNHKLQGKYKDMYECHVRPDILIIYEKDENNNLITLIAIGSHSELFK